jgi:two-component system copper resistance phosphate regulon response regulator CusR
MQKILIIEDEVKMARSLQIGLMEESYNVEMAHDGNTGERMALKNRYDLIITDIIMPGQTGTELCRNIRLNGINTPVLMLTALGTISNKVQGFDSGADDYLPKPFDFQELLARVKALLRRSPEIQSQARILQFADLTLNTDTKTAKRQDKIIELTAKEFTLLEFFLLNKGRVLSKAEIAERVWGINFDTGTNVVEVYVNYLRKKIDKDFENKLIHTMIGMGYILKQI